jgi:hypothetical protein
MRASSQSCKMLVDKYVVKMRIPLHLTIIGTWLIWGGCGREEGTRWSCEEDAGWGKKILGKLLRPQGDETVMDKANATSWQARRI